MTILCIETSTSVCSAAICKDGAPIKQCISYEGSNHARLLPRYIEELLSFAREEGLSIDAVALSEGPGSYTGLRIGASTAKGLCYGLNIPLIPIPTLEVLCEAARVRSTLRIQPSDILLPMIDARRMEVYTWAYPQQCSTDGHRQSDRAELFTRKGKGAVAVVVENEESLFSPSLLGEGRGEASYFYFGDGAAKCQEVLTGEKWHFIPGIVPEAQYMGGLVAARKMISGAELAYYEPFYLKEFIAAPSHVKGLK